MINAINPIDERGAEFYVYLPLIMANNYNLAGHLKIFTSN